MTLPGHDPGVGPLLQPGAGPRRAGDRRLGHLLARDRPVRDADGPATVGGRQRRGRGDGAARPARFPTRRRSAPASRRSSPRSRARHSRSSPRTDGRRPAALRPPSRRSCPVRPSQGLGAIGGRDGRRGRRGGRRRPPDRTRPPSRTLPTPMRDAGPNAIRIRPAPPPGAAATLRAPPVRTSRRRGTAAARARWSGSPGSSPSPSSRSPGFSSSASCRRWQADRPPRGTVVVPNFVGMTFTAAQDLATQKGINVVRKATVVDATKPVGTVLAQDPTAGARSLGGRHGQSHGCRRRRNGRRPGPPSQDRRRGIPAPVRGRA